MGSEGDDRQELQVRLAAQRLLTRHLILPVGIAVGQPPTLPETYWQGVRIDLVGATLIDFDFSWCRTENADFRGVKFSGDASFRGAQFSGDAGFSEAQFSGYAGFGEAQFSGAASFGGAQFGGAQFGGAQFSGDAWFDKAQFNGAASFREAQFSEFAWFDKAQFERLPSFDNARASSVSQHVWPVGWRLEPPAPDSPTCRIIRDPDAVPPDLSASAATAPNESG